MVRPHQAAEKLFSYLVEFCAEEILKQLHSLKAGLPGIQYTSIRGAIERELAIIHR